MIILLFQVVILVLITFLAVFFFLVTYLQSYFKRRRKLRKGNQEQFTVGYFHPYCNAGGGGEKVLWHSVRVLQDTLPKAKIVIYTGDKCSSSDNIIDKAKERFNVELNDEINFIYLQKRIMIEAERYPYFTLLGQSIGSMFLGLEALFSYVPDIYIDTTGCAFTLPVFSCLGGCICASYVHYPTISTDMLMKVSSRTCAVNNRTIIARSKFLSGAKIYYYKMFAWLYSMCGNLNNCVMVNSSWTEGHIKDLWKKLDCTYKVYPPCDTSCFKSLQMAPDIGENREIKMIYLAQFRPEKDHPLILRSISKLKESLQENILERIKVVFVGSCRNDEDCKRVDNLKMLSHELGIFSLVEFKINLSFDELKAEMQSCIIGLHSMWNEHFGISVVECMAAGLIMIAHKSGGPKADIICEEEISRTGFLAEDETEYARAIQKIISLSPEQRMKIREAARRSVDRFSNEEFHKSFSNAINVCITGMKLMFSHLSQTELS